jgi:hypothetical protein
MDIQKLNKQELIDLLHKQNQELEKFNAIDLKATIDLKNEAIKNEHELRQENKKLLDKIKDIEEKKERELKTVKEEKENIILDNKKEKENIILKFEEEIDSLEKTLKFEQDGIQATIDLKNEAIKNEHQLRQEANILKNQIKTTEDSNNHLVKKINELAGILEEYVTTFEEQQKILAIVLKNNNYIQSALKQKIEIFNKGEYQ